MDPNAPVADDDQLLRHVPGGPTWQVPPTGRVSSVNFRPRAGEAGISVSRVSLTSPDQLLARLGDPARGSRVAGATVADVRALGLDVVPVPRDDDPGHVEIRSVTADLNDKEVQRALAKLFDYVI